MENVKDIDGNSYKTVRIGDQIWMAENFRVTHYSNGDRIPNLTDGNDWVNTEDGAYCNYENEKNYVETYGRLYNWFAVNDKRRLAPKGWHIPTDEEWNELEYYLGGPEVAGGKLKSIGTITNRDGLWNKYTFVEEGGTDESGFTALPGGWRTNDSGEFCIMGSYCYFWSSTEGKSKYAYNRILEFGRSSIDRMQYYKRCGFSVRCVKD